MKRPYYKSILLYLQILFGGILLLFTIATVADYSRDVALGYTLSFLILLVYAFTLYKSFKMWEKERVGLAYFLTVAGFLILTFSQIVNCANSVVINFH